MRTFVMGAKSTGGEGSWASKRVAESLVGKESAGGWLSWSTASIVGNFLRRRRATVGQRELIFAVADDDDDDDDKDDFAL